MDKRLILGILSIAFIGIGACAFVALKNNHRATSTQAARDEQVLLPFQKSFDPRFIASSCAKIRVGRLFEDCYSPKVRTIESQSSFGPVGIALKATIGFQVLNQDYNNLRLSGSPPSTLHGDFLALSLSLSTLREIQNHRAQNAVEKNQQVELFAKMASTYVDLRARIMGQLQRAPAQAGSFQSVLRQYDSAYQQLANHP